jgi:hypothetical protein
VRLQLGSVLLALAVVALAPSLGVAQYAPKWHVGDWWIVKEWMPDLNGGSGSHWQHCRYDVLRTEKVDRNDCFVLQWGDTLSPRSGPRTLYYVSSDSLRIIRRVDYFQQAGKLLGPSTFNCPQGMYGPNPGEPQLPLFPLDTTATRDSTFVSHFRQFASLADSVSLRRYREDPDQSSGRPISAGNGVLFASLAQSSEPTGPGGPEVARLYSLQLWSEDLPWRLCSEWGQYLHTPGRTVRTYVETREWLIRSGHTGK